MTPPPATAARGPVATVSAASVCACPPRLRNDAQRAAVAGLLDLLLYFDSLFVYRELKALYPLSGRHSARVR